MEKIFEDRRRLFDHSEGGSKPEPIVATVVAHYDPALNLLVIDMTAEWGDTEVIPEGMPYERRDVETTRGYRQAEIWAFILGRMAWWHALLDDFPATVEEQCRLNAEYERRVQA